MSKIRNSAKQIIRNLAKHINNAYRNGMYLLNLREVEL